MNCLLAINIFNEVISWISRHPSRDLLIGLLGLIILIIALYYAFKFKSAKAKTFAELTTEKKRANEVSTKLENAKKKMTSAKAELKQAHQENKSLNAQVASLSEQNKEIDQLRESIKQKDVKITNLERNLSESQNQFESTKKMLEQANKDLQQLEKEKQRKEELEREVTTLRESDNTKSDKISGFMSSLSEKDSIIGQKDRTIKELETKIQNFPDVSKLMEENELNIEKLQKATAELDAKEKALKEANSLVSSRGENIVNLQNELRQAYSTIELLNNEIAKLKQQIEEISKPVGEPEIVEPHGEEGDNGSDEVEGPIDKPETDETQGGNGDNGSDEGEDPVDEPEIDETPGEGGDNGSDEGEDPVDEPETDEPPGEEVDNGSDDGKDPVGKPETDETPGKEGDKGSDEGKDPVDKPETDETLREDGDNGHKAGEAPVDKPEKDGFFDFIPKVAEDEENEDLPSIDKKTGQVKRSILQVIDIEQDPPAIIDSEEFFNEKREKIARVARMLAEADETGREAYLCACCKRPVKISKRDYGYREVLFFSHCQRDIECEWKQDHRIIHTKQPTGSSYGRGLHIDIKARRRMIKDLIIRNLQTEESKAKGVKDVEEDKRIKSKYRFMRYRIAGIFARYKERNLVFELQTRDVLMDNVVNKDIFYRLHDHHVIWIFGADEGTGYDYIVKHVQVNTMFANRRNVFIIDKEAIDACEERHELVLKCNYLDPDNKWHYRKETTGNNGTLVTLDDLLFDDEMCKPYLFDANIDYFRLHPDAETDYLDSILSREKLLEDLENTYNGQLAERRKKKPTPKVETPSPAEPGYESTPDPEPTPEITNTKYPNRYFYHLDGKYGIVDANKNFILPCEYDDIESWAPGKYRVMVIDQWGVVDESGNKIVDIKYVSIGDLEKGKALIQTSLESYKIDENGNRLPDYTKELHNGWIKFRFGTKWGIMDEKKEIIVEPVYDEIGSFRCRLIGIRNGSFQKLVPRYEYRLKMHCTCTDNIGNRAVYDMNGLLLKETSLKLQTKGQVYKNKVISNISFKTNTIYINDVSTKKEKEKFPHVDNDYDFAMGEILTGVILKKVMKKIFVQFKGGRLSYFNKTLLEKAGKRLADYGKGKEITLQKTGFDSDFERTEWKLVE